MPLSSVSSLPTILPRPSFALDSRLDPNAIFPAAEAPLRLVVSSVGNAAVNPPRQNAGAATGSQGSISSAPSASSPNGSTGTGAGDGSNGQTSPGEADAAAAGANGSTKRTPTIAIAASVGAIAAVAFGAVAVVARRRHQTVFGKSKVAPITAADGIYKDHKPSPLSRSISRFLPRFAPIRKPSFRLGAAARIDRGSFGSSVSTAASPAVPGDANVISYISPSRSARPLMPALHLLEPAAASSPFSSSSSNAGSVPSQAPELPLPLYRISDLYSDLASEARSQSSKASGYASLSVNSESTRSPSITVPPASWRASDAPTDTSNEDRNIPYSVIMMDNNSPFRGFDAAPRDSSASSASTQRDIPIGSFDGTAAARRLVHFRSGDSIVGIAQRPNSASTTQSSVASDPSRPGSPALPTLAFSKMSWHDSTVRTQSALRLSVLSGETETCQEDEEAQEQPRPMVELNHSDARVRSKGAGHSRSRSGRFADADSELPQFKSLAQPLPRDNKANYPAVLGDGWSMAN
ncbi:hypothetical protein HDU87_000225 [Geranomyces variabilis]|uniref:Uncharacterized protein n=1 Tax=Geranomyces variabilis TaxID=109894 RepID=A0AAD5TSJ1_9FUNG|nr:hypothetical protein HDU87_000225 [Geranomyces variabilis]